MEAVPGSSSTQSAARSPSGEAKAASTKIEKMSIFMSLDEVRSNLK
jgi:hypothetical protein